MIFLSQECPNCLDIILLYTLKKKIQKHITNRIKRHHEWRMWDGFLNKVHHNGFRVMVQERFNRLCIIHNNTKQKQFWNSKQVFLRSMKSTLFNFTEMVFLSWRLFKCFCLGVSHFLQTSKPWTSLYSPKYLVSSMARYKIYRVKIYETLPSGIFQYNF